MSEKTSNTSGGIGFIGLLQILFIGLKLCKIINWKWWQVMLPLEISGGLIIVLLLTLIVFGIVKYMLKKRK